MVNPTTWRPAQQSNCLLKETGLVLLSNSANFNVTRSGVVNIENDLLWYSVGFSTSPSVVSNAGSIRKTDGVGTAIFLARYTNLGGQTTGSVSFQSAVSGGRVFFWNNANGGGWDVASNWLPVGVPSTNDYVFITLPGSYRVLVTGSQGVKCHILEIGSSAADVDFRIDYFSSLTVSSLLVLANKQTTIHGPITTGTMIWSGLTITGSWHTAGNVPITVTKKFQGLQNLDSSSHTLTMVNLNLAGNSSFDSAFGSLTLDRANITVRAGATLLMARNNVNVRQRGNPTFTQGFVNYGTLKFGTSYSRWYADIDNRGTLVFSQYCCCGLSRVYFYGLFLNDQPNAVARFYSTRVYFYSDSRVQSRRGAMEFWGLPIRPSSFPTIPGNCQSNRLDDFINGLYNTSNYYRSYPGFSSEPLWNAGYSMYVYFYESSSNIKVGTRNLEIGSLKTFGPVYLYMYSRYSSNVTITRQLNLHRLTTLYMRSGSVNARNGYFTMPSQVQTGRVYASRGWKLQLNAENSRWWSARSIILYSGTSLTASGSSTLSFGGSFIISSGSTVSLQHSTFTVEQNLVHSGSLTLQNTVADIKRGLLWSQGTISGGDSWLYIRGRSMSSGSQQLSLSGSNMRLALQGQLPPQDGRGVVAEYFQYRVATSSTPRLSRINSFYEKNSSSAYQVPESFDDPSTPPTTTRYLSSISSLPVGYGNAPIVYRTSGSVDSNSPLTFTYNYAVRYTFYLWVNYTGMYNFYFSSYYTSRPVRMWFNDTSPTNTVYTPTYPANVTLSGFLNRGYNKLRLDVIQSSSYAEGLRALFLVSYEQPGSLGPLPMTYNLFYRRWVGSDLEYVLPKSTLYPSPVCELPGTAQEICGNFSAVSCWTISGSTSVNAKSGPSLWVTKSGVLDVTSSRNWTYTTPRLSLVSSGIVTRSSGTGEIYLQSQYVPELGCLPSNAETSVVLGVPDGTFPPTTKPPPTMPPTTPLPPVERNPRTWTVADLQDWIKTVDEGKFKPLARWFEKFNGVTLLLLSRDQFLEQVPPELKDLAAELYDAFKTQDARTSPSTSSDNTGVAVGAAVGAAAILVIIIVLAVVLWRRRARSGGMGVEPSSKRLSNVALVAAVDNPGYASGENRGGALPGTVSMGNPSSQCHYDTATYDTADGKVEFGGNYDTIGEYEKKPLSPPHAEEQLYEDMSSNYANVGENPYEYD